MDYPGSFCAALVAIRARLRGCWGYSRNALRYGFRSWVCRMKVNKEDSY